MRTHSMGHTLGTRGDRIHADLPCVDRQAGDGILDAGHCSVIAVCVACQVLYVNLLLVPCESHLTWAGVGPSLQSHADFPLTQCIMNSGLSLSFSWTVFRRLSLKAAWEASMNECSMNETPTKAAWEASIHECSMNAIPLQSPSHHPTILTTIHHLTNSPRALR